jgi:nucleotide-binding universal stress UspA family protein
MKRILVATDGSAGSQHAVTKAIELASGLGAAVTFVTAVPEAGASVDPVSGSPGATVGAGGRAAVAAAVAEAKSAGVEADFEFLQGEPAAAIVDCARDREADVIVVGSRGLGAVRRLILGSVSREVVEAADRPVLIVK